MSEDPCGCACIIDSEGRCRFSQQWVGESRTVPAAGIPPDTLAPATQDEDTD